MIRTLKNTITTITIATIAAIAFADQGPRFTPGIAGSRSVIGTETHSGSNAARAVTNQGPQFTPGTASSTIDIASVSAPVSFKVFALIGSDVEADRTGKNTLVPSGRFGTTLTR